MTAFDTRFSLPAYNLTVDTYAGAATTGDFTETALDVEYAHAIAPGAKILLVQVATFDYPHLDAAVQFAADTTGVSTVSMSYGSHEFNGEQTSDYDSSVYTQNAGHNGVAYVASSGDGGYIEYPAASPNVIGVGGTTLTVNANGTYGSEKAWVR